MQNGKINSYDILKLLENKHADDLFVTECKNGSTWLQNHFRVDAWSMKKSWANPCFTAYEIKISRSDFQRDCKYPEYFKMCNNFYFVCPPKLINVSEIPLEAGLIYTSNNVNSLVTKKKAIHRDIDIPVDTLLYILMSRVKIIGPNKLSKESYWSNWLKSKSDSLDIGSISSKRIIEIIKKRILMVEEEVHKIKFENDSLKKIIKNTDESIKKLDEIGIDLDTLKNKYLTNRKLNDFIISHNGDPESFLVSIEQIYYNSKKIIDSLKNEKC